jgi:hypothetical protein
MQALQPMQMLLSKSTMPSARANMAAVGQAVTHGACALIAPRHLMRPPYLRELARLDVLDVGARHRERYFVLRLAGRRAGVTAYAEGVVYHFAPLGRLRLSRVDGKLSHNFGF